MTSAQQSLRGRTALVTGATSGIGRATAIQLAREGAEVIVHGRDASRGEQVVAEIAGALGKVRFIAADLSDPTEIRRLADEAGEVDVLVNNAGISWFGPTADLDVATYDALFDSNVRAAYFLVAALAPKMAAKGGGSIVNVASMVAAIGIAGAAAYGGTKATLAAMTRSWAAEFSPRGVRVNAVAPGPVYTAADPARIEALGATTLLGRAAQAEEIAQVITFLASPASAYITGATVAADGGRTAV
ncbi:MAG TPA: SDR family oxidoreductase [Pseudonocardia sp.]|uniref:SDR family NAD(P)-dependent oxidoreductase n=1 Tax=Pseudonocardia sp. TaxID=60912 RepID=UPI002B8D3EDC|nr:SDR family oxidoreductase [Pseudonocardia sp.]HTF54062.1 SDR family oxidoreductase [Pseudonocardia sp.]